jgi:hypothetical protein
VATICLREAILKHRHGEINKQGVMVRLAFSALL